MADGEWVTISQDDEWIDIPVHDKVTAGQMAKLEFGMETMPAALEKVPLAGGFVSSFNKTSYAEAKHRLESGQQYPLKRLGSRSAVDYRMMRAPGVSAEEAIAGKEFEPHTGRELLPVTREEDEELVRSYEQRMYADRTWGATVTKGAAILPSYMAEFAMTKGLYDEGKLIVGAGANPGILAKTLQWIAGSEARTLAFAPRVGEQVAERRLQVEFGRRPNENVATSILKGWNTVLVENMSEVAGENITKGLGWGLSKLPFGKKLIPALKDAWIKTTGGTGAEFARRLMSKGGYSNIIGEIGEERLATILHAIVNDEDFGAGKDAPMGIRAWEGLKQDFTLSNATSELAVLSIPMLASNVATKVTDKARSFFDGEKAKEMDMPQPYVEQTSSAIIDNPDLTTEQKEVGLRYIGDIETELVSYFGDRFPGEIETQEDLERIGNAIAQDLGIDADIKWTFSKRPSRSMYGQVKGKNNIIIYPNYSAEQKKQTIVHELGHIVKAPKVVQKQGTVPKNVKFVKAGESTYNAIVGQRIWMLPNTYSEQEAKEKYLRLIARPKTRKIHYPEFNKWVADNVKKLTEEVIEGNVPIHRPEAIGPIGQQQKTGERYEGQAYRTETGSERHPDAKNAADVIRYEREELGNVEDFTYITDAQLVELEKRPASDIVWVTRTKEEAARYGSAREDISEPPSKEDLENVTDYTEQVQGGQIIADIGEDGVLVLKTAAPVQGTNYNEATANTSAANKNPLIRQVESKSNSDRMLLIQFASDLLTTQEEPLAKEYYDRLYAEKPGYERPADFWEVPKWIGEMANTVPKSDVYVVRDLEEAKQFLRTSGYDSIAFSALDVNKHFIKELARAFPNKVIVGGFINKGYFKDTPNVKWYDSIEDMAKGEKFKYEPGTDYRHFEGTKTIPRLCLSKGCLSHCAFCTVPKGVTTMTQDVIDSQVDAMADLHTELVYLDDKTFGQADNYKMLPDLYKRIKNSNPEFQGFIVQTSASQMNKLSDEFLQRSGIAYIELGVETYNDPILKKLHKPASVKLIDKALNKARINNIQVIPNIMIGLPGETKATYQRTLDFLNNNSDIISHINAYNLAVYEGTELAETMPANTDVDISENVVKRSYYKNPQLHQDFADAVYNLGMNLLDKAKSIKSPVEQMAVPRMPKKKALRLGHQYPKMFNWNDSKRRDFMEEHTGKRSMKDMTPDERDTYIAALEQVAKEKGMAIVRGRERRKTPIVVNGESTTMEDIVDGAINTADKLPPKIKLPETIHRRFFRKIRRSGIAKRLGRLFFGIDNSPLYELANILEQSQPGVLTDVFDKNIQLGLSLEDGHLRTFSDMFLEYLEDNGISRQDLAKISNSANPRMFQEYLEQAGRGTDVVKVRFGERTYELSPAEILDIYLIAQQKDGMRHLLGGGLVISDVKTGALSETDIDNITSIVKNNPVLLKLAKLMPTIDKLLWKPALNSTSMELDNVEIAKQENWWGLEVLMPKQSAKRKFNVNFIENKSILRDRTKASNPLVVRDALQRMTMFELATAEYFGMASPSRTARTLINDKEFSELLRSKGYNQVRENMRLILDRAASAPPLSGSLDTLLSGALPGIYRGVLFFNPRVVMSQFTSSTNYAAFVSEKYLPLIKNGLSPKAIERTLKLSNKAWARFYMGHSNLELGELASSDATLRLLTQTTSDKNKLGITLRIADMAALASGMEISIAEYADAQKGRITGESALYWANKDTSFKENSEDWRRAVTERAEYLWHKSQPSWDKWSRSAITSDPSAIRRLFFLFRSFHEKSLTILHSAHTNYENSNKTIDDRYKLAKSYGAVLSGYTLNTVLRALIMAGLMREFKHPFEYLKDLITAPFRMLPILGHIIDGSIRSFLNALTGRRSEYRGEALESLPIEVVNQITRAPINFTQAVGYYLAGDAEKGNKSMKRAVEQVYTGTGLIMGIPVYELRRLFKKKEKKSKAKGPAR